MRLAWLLLLVACEKAPPEARKIEPLPVPPIVEPESPRVRYAAKTQNSAAGPNQTFFNIVEDESLFVVTDAGPKSGKDAANSLTDPARVAAEDMSPFPGARCATTGPEVTAQLDCVVRQVNDLLVRGKLGTASLAAVTVEGWKAYVAVSGDVRVVWIHAKTREVEVKMAREPTKPLGTSSTTEQTVFTLELGAGDKIAIVNRGLFETIGARGMAKNLTGDFPTPKALEDAVHALIGDAERVPDHPALTAILLYVVP